MKKLKASTLVETIVAMTILMISFGAVVALMISNSGNQNRLKLNAYLLSEDIKSETKVLRSFENEEYKYDNLVIEKNIEKYNNSKSIRILVIEAYTKDEKFIYKTQELVNVENK